jgi:hypothetical protein
MKFNFLIIFMLIFFIGLIAEKSYSQTVQFNKKDPYKGERIRVTGKDWQPYENITIELSKDSTPRRGMILTKCNDSVIYTYESGVFGGSCLIPTSLEYSTAYVYVNGIYVGEISVR